MRKWRRTFDRWLEWAKAVKHETAVRVRKANKYGDYAEVNKCCVNRDRMFFSLINRHQRGQLTDSQYFDEIVKLNTHYEQDLAAEMQSQFLDRQK